MTFAKLLHQVGGMGRFQIINVALLSIPVLLMASHNLLQNFTAAIPEHHCKIHINANNTRYLNATLHLNSQDLLQVAIPMDGNQQPEKCRRFVTAQWYFLDPNATESNGTQLDTEPCIEGWTYDRSVYTSTIITEWDLVCNLRKLQQVAQSIYMAGVLVGALLLGGLSDSSKYGAICIFPWLPLLCFIQGLAVSCSLPMCRLNKIPFPTVVEWIPTQYRTITIAITGFAYTMGQILLAGVAYSIPDWRWLQLTVSLPFFIFLIYSWWFAESARWLVLSGKTDTAVKVLQRVARVNGKREEGEQITTEVKRSNGVFKEGLDPQLSSYTVVDLVRTPAIRQIFFCLSAVFSTSFSYYGLAMDLQNFGVNIYLIQLIFGAVDFPAKVVVTISMSYIGRRVTLSASLFLAGLVIIGNIFVSRELQIVRTSLAVIGKGCLSATFNCVFLFTTELYPTPIRQTGLGFGSTMARIGGIVAPMVKMLDEYFTFLPPVIYGAAPLISGIAAIFLPETLNKPLPDTIEEVESRLV
uniref:Solute carrier family 22 member 8 n=1 Tax=Pelusios castaneus TaxID=367368 RepID=A0A8C8R7D9_9SAUR